MKRLVLVNERHLIDAPVTGDAADALGDVDGVVEVTVVTELVDAIPGNRLVGLQALADGFEHLAPDPYLLMAVHAGLRRRDAREGGILNRGVTKTTIDAQFGDVVMVAERHRLFSRDADVRGVGRAREDGQRPADPGEREDGAVDADERQRVETSMKYLGHRVSRIQRSGSGNDVRSFVSSYSNSDAG